jgi:two-component system, response regulator YesN
MYLYIIVDDEAIIRKGLISKINDITSMEISCAGEAADGVEGLQLIEEVNPDIIITDMKMRKMDGMEFLDRVSEKYPDKPIIVISAHKAFSYVNKAIEKRAIGYVLKPFSTEEVEKQLKNATQQIEQQKSLNQLKEKVATYEQKKEQDVLFEVILEPWNELMEDKLIAKKFSTKDFYLLISINTMAPGCTSLTEKICSEYLNQIPSIVMDNPVNKSQCLILMSVEDERLVSKMRVKAEHISLHVQKAITGFVNYICISEVFHGIWKLNRCYLNNDKMLRKIHFSDKVRILHTGDISKDEIVIYNEEYLKQLFMKMKYQKGTTAEILQEFFNGINVEEHTLGDIGAVCEELINMINGYAVQKGVGTDDIMAVFYRRYLFCETIEKMQKEISGYITLIFNSIELQENDEEHLWGLMERYIRSNYHNKLTLQILSEELFVTPEYCSKLLKSKLNKSFNEYISELRIEKARKLLRETNLSVENISDEIGYSNPKYFFKIFKKLTLHSPMEYRKKDR